MANKRMVNGAMWEDDFFNTLSIFEKLLWIGLITACADDQGRIQNNSALIRSKVFPMDDIKLSDIDKALNSYLDKGKIVFYERNGKKLIQIVKWWNHQQGQWAGKSSFQSPKGWVDRERYQTSGREIITRNWKQKGGYQDVYIDDYIDSDLDCLLDDNVKDNVKDKDNDNKNTPPNDDLTYLTIWTNTTGMLAYPQKERDNIPYTIQAIYTHHKDKTTDYLKPYYEDWLSRGYSKTNPGWLDWALAGNVPENKNGNNKVSEEEQRMIEARKKLAKRI